MNTWTNDDWLTPRWILDKLGKFDVDPCASTPMPWQIADRQLTIADNGLLAKWEGRVWLNPPYSDVTPWLARMEGMSGMSLLNSNTEVGWFQDFVWNMSHAVFFFRARIRFHRPDGSLGQTGKSGSVLVAYSEDDAKVLYAAGFEGKFVPLVISLSVEINTTWRKLIRTFLKECGGAATLEQLYELASSHPKISSNKNWKAKVRQSAQRYAKRVGPSLYQQTILI